MVIEMFQLPQRRMKELFYLTIHSTLQFYMLKCHDICYTSCGTLVGMRNSSMGPPGGIDPRKTNIQITNASYS